jgi:uncharacterized protein YbjT (DUF2867 family)
MIAVTGASGKLGSAVIGNLLKYLPASEVVASVRKPEEAGSLATKGIEVRHGDYDDPDSLSRSFAGANRLLLISASGIDHEGRVARHRNAINAAIRAMVGHIYYTSLLPGEGSVAYVMKAHLDTESILKTCGLPYTILRNSAYAEGWKLYLGDIASGKGVVPGDGPVSWVSQADLAEGTAKLLISGTNAGETLNLTGSLAINLKTTAEILSGATGKQIVVRIVPLEEYVSHLKETGKTEEFARQWATTYSGLERGEFGKVDPFLGMLLGRPLQTLEDVVTA